MTESAIEAAANAMLALERENARPSHLDYARAAVAAALPSKHAEIERLRDEIKLLRIERERLTIGYEQLRETYLKAADEIERLCVMYNDCIKDLREASE